MDAVGTQSRTVRTRGNGVLVGVLLGVYLEIHGWWRHQRRGQRVRTAAMFEGADHHRVADAVALAGTVGFGRRHHHLLHLTRSNP
jgi:hypothetical protein